MRLLPAWWATPLWEQLDKDLMAMGVSSAPGEAMDNFSKSILLGRVAQPADVVGTVRFLASPASDYMNDGPGSDDRRRNDPAIGVSSGGISEARSGACVGMETRCRLPLPAMRPNILRIPMAGRH
jgi:hypothetical protein